MQTLRRELFTPIGMGICAHNIERGDKAGHFWPIQLMPTLIGDVDLGTAIRKGKGILSDINTSPYAVSVTQSAFISAIWMPRTNVATQPDLRAGEKVMLYRMLDTDQYYYEPLGMDDNLRRLETQIYAFSANPDAKDAERNRDNCIVLEISGHDNHITLTTPTKKVNGELVAYTFQIDQGKGTFTFEDDIDNFFHLNSTEHLWQLYNADGTLVELDKKEINIHADTAINVTTKTFNLTATTINIKATMTNITSDITYKGNTVHTGNITQTGNLGITGSISATGGMTAGGAVKAASVSAPTMDTASITGLGSINGVGIGSYLN